MQAQQAALHTFLALARAPVCCTEHSEISLGVLCTCRARCLTGPVLVEVPKAVAVDATELPNFGLEVTYDHGASDGRRTEQPGRIQNKLIPCSSQTNGFLEGVLPAEQDVHLLTAPPTDADPAGHGAQLDSSTA